MALPETSRLRYLLKSWRSSLQDRSDYRRLERKRRCYKNCFACFLIIMILNCSYRYIWLSYDSISVKKTVVNSTTTTAPQNERRQILPRCINTLRFGPTKLNLSIMNLFDVDHKYPMVKEGGYYYPPNCSTGHKVAIIVSYRKRPVNLAIFLYNMHPILMEQQLEYQIFIIEQYGYDLFNKGCLYNIGFKEVVKLKKFHCIVFHDLDLLPMFLEIQYTCSTSPKHISTFVEDFSPKIPGEPPHKHKSLFGGVVALTTEMVSRVNGYSNVYFGWGGEDNDMLWRLRAAGYLIHKYKTSVGLFTMLPHIRAPRNKLRHYLLESSVERHKVEGLSTLEYVVIQKKSHHLFTYILVDINPRKQNITDLMRKWVRGNNTI